MAYYEKRHKRCRLRRSRPPAAPPILIIFVMFSTVFLAVQWRARLLPYAMRVPRQFVTRRPTKRANWRATHPQTHSRRQHTTRPPRHPPRAPSSLVSQQQQQQTPTTLFQPAHQKPATNSSPSLSSHHLAAPSAPNSSHTSPSPVSIPHLLHHTNQTPGHRVCRSYLCTLWDRIPDRIPLPPLHPTSLPWLHTLPNNPSSLPLNPRTDSIFSARRKGPWIGCARRDALICTGVYRSLKRTGSSSLFDADCMHHLSWLPKILDKLLSEYRLIRLICGIHPSTALPRATRVLGSNPHTRIIPFDARTASAATFPCADTLLVRETLHNGNLISAVSFLKRAKKSNSFKFLIHDNFPHTPHNTPTTHKMHLNTALAPFSFPPPLYTHSDARDTPDIEIVCRPITHLFSTRTTPSMRDLIDPHRRHILS